MCGRHFFISCTLLKMALKRPPRNSSEWSKRRLKSSEWGNWTMVVGPSFNYVTSSTSASASIHHHVHEWLNGTETDLMPMEAIKSGISGKNSLAQPLDRWWGKGFFTLGTGISLGDERRDGTKIGHCCAFNRYCRRHRLSLMLIGLVNKNDDDNGNKLLHSCFVYFGMMRTKMVIIIMVRIMTKMTLLIFSYNKNLLKGIIKICLVFFSLFTIPSISTFLIIYHRL